jgi:LAO/AO transport system kinase
MVDELLRRLGRHERLALSRLLTLVSRGQHLEAIRRALADHHPLRSDSAEPRRRRVVAITGNAGVGKSTLVGQMIPLIRETGRSVAVLACDPQSPLTGGALLGDRVRMPSRPDDLDVLVRSLAVVSGQQAIAENLQLMVDLLVTFGFELVLLETAGAGQGDIAVRSVADLVVVLIQPESGDELQWEKAGLLEVADVVVVNKGDLPGAQRVESQVRELLNLPGCREVPVVRVSAARRQGLDALWEVLVQRLGG